jgi:hypothetical protein
MKNLLLFSLLFFSLIACKKSVVNAGKCYSNDFTYKETKVNNLPGSNSVIVSFDVKNNAKTDYELAKNGIGNVVYYKMMVKTTDGTSYETKNIFTSNISAGATVSNNILGSYGAGKTYQSYTVTLYCQ